MRQYATIIQCYCSELHKNLQINWKNHKSAHLITSYNANELISIRDYKTWILA